MPNDIFAKSAMRSALTLLVAGAFAGEADALSGSVLSADGEAIAVAEIRVTCGTEVVEIVSAVNGAFTVDGQSAKPSCRFDVSAPGHAPFSMPVGEFIADGHVLRLPAIRPVEELVVVADRISRPFATVYVPALAVFSNPSARADPLMVVATAPSSSTVGESPALRLRGSPVGTVGLFVGEVPVYEPVRGVDVAANSVEPSAFGSIPYDIEIYPSNPPLYLFNAGMAAARLLPPTSAGDSLALMTTGISGTHAFERGNTLGRIAGSWSNMGGMLALNPALEETTVSHSKSAAANLHLHTTAAHWGEVQALLHVDDQNGGYPLTLFSSQGVWRNERRRTLATASLQRSFGLAALKLSAGLTRSDGGGSFRSWRFTSINNHARASGSDFRRVSLPRRRRCGPPVSRRLRLGAQAHRVDAQLRSRRWQALHGGRRTNQIARGWRTLLPRLQPREERCRTPAIPAARCQRCLSRAHRACRCPHDLRRVECSRPQKP